MKNQSTLLIILMQFIYLTSFSQLRVVNSGNIGIGTNNPIGKLHVNGRIFLTGNNNTFRILPDNPGTEIGTSTGKIDFWYTTTGFNHLWAAYFHYGSDSLLKTNIASIDSSLSIIKALHGVKYQYRQIIDSVVTDSPDSTGYHYGFIAQDVEQVLPDLVAESHGYKGIDYNGFIPYLVEAIKSQQQIIDTINDRLSTLEDAVNACCSSQRVTGSTLPNKQIIELSSKNSIILNQNDPNPFAQSTTITWFLPEDSKNAKLYFYDNTGRILKTVLISETGDGELLVYCSDLKSGIYTYSLVVNDKVIDSKKMVCTK
ncbi:MAG TPA: tail fiber domain-containing protein [Bacteroidia bacterium]|nr:tail fiber domain-containing protein [Bacteroidia bacterium]